MRISRWFTPRAWYLMIPVILGVSWARVEDLRASHQQIWQLTGRYTGVRQEMRQIRSHALSRIKTEPRPQHP